MTRRSLNKRPKPRADPLVSRRYPRAFQAISTSEILETVFVPGILPYEVEECSQPWFLLPVSERVLAAAHIEDGRLLPQHFETLAGLHDLTPDLEPHGGGLGLVRVYYRLVQALGVLLGKHTPVLAAWSERERAICTRYAAVQVGRRLQASLELAVSLRSC